MLFVRFYPLVARNPFAIIVISAANLSVITRIRKSNPIHLMASNDVPNLVPNIEIDNDLEMEIAQLLEVESDRRNQPCRPPQHPQRPSLRLMPEPGQDGAIQTKGRTGEEQTNYTDSSKLLSPTTKPTLVKRSSVKSGTPTSPQDAGGFLSPHAKGKPSSSAKQRPADIEIRPLTSTSQMSGFSLRPISGIGIH